MIRGVIRSLVNRAVRSGRSARATWTMWRITLLNPSVLWGGQQCRRGL